LPKKVVVEPCAPLSNIQEDKKPYFPSSFHAIPVSYCAGGRNKTKAKQVTMLQELDLLYPFVNFFGREPRSVSDGPPAPHSGRGEIIVHLTKGTAYFFPEVLADELIRNGIAH
jgi:hypothetical protein